MLNSAATVEDGGKQESQQAAGSEQVSKPGGGVMRFAYATGSRPLEGYTIKRGVGVGGFGEVYFAVSDAGKEVALKRVQRNLDVEVRGVSQCLNLKHPNLIALYDIKYDDEGQAWVVMEYVGGESLKDVIDRNPNGMPPEEVRQRFCEIAAGVAYLHDHGIVHRDLKPGNIFVDEDCIKIGDYGLSKYISCSRRSGQTESVGTFHYMAPEIGKGVYGKEIDVYAMGIILYEMLTGRVPFDGESSQEIIMKHLTAEPNLEDVSGPYRDLIRKALYKDPGKRYANVAEMLACFDSLQAGGAPLATAVPPVRNDPSSDNEPLFIGDEPGDGEMYFGPVKEVVSADVVPATGKRPGAATPPEPIAQAVRESGNKVVSWWRRTNLSTSMKVLLLIGVIFLFILNSEWLVPMGIVLGATYLVYFGVRSLVLAINGSPAKPSNPTTPVAGPPATPARRPKAPDRKTRCARRRRWRDEARAQLRKKPFGERVGELSGSFLTSAIVAAVLCLLMMIVAGKPLDDSVYTWTFYAWMTLTSVAGAWTVLLVSKFWEGGDGEQFSRRFVMLIAGLAIGVAAFGFGSYLEVLPKDDLIVRDVPIRAVSASMYEPGGQLKLPAFLVYFALLLGIVRWWSQADPLRASRLSLWATGACVFWAWILDMIWHFPQPWGFVLAATMSVAVQLSAPWLGPKERSRIRQRLQQA